MNNKFADSHILVSVVMPMRNAEAYVQDALQSILQEHAIEFEVVVVDDGSTDKSRSLVSAMADSRVRIIDGPCQGFAASLNTGLRAARGRAVIQCDADDRIPIGRLPRQWAWLMAHPEHAAVCAAFSTMDAQGRAIADMGPRIGLAEQDIHSELSAGVTRTSLCTYMLRREVFDQIGYLRGYFETSPDIDFQMRLGEQLRVGYDPFNSYYYRLHDESITHSQATARRVFFEQTCHVFQQQRLSRGSDDLSDGNPPTPPSKNGHVAPGAVSHIQGMLVGEAWRTFVAGRTTDALGLAWRATAKNPSAITAWRALLLIALRGLFRGLRRSKAKIDQGDFTK